MKKSMETKDVKHRILYLALLFLLLYGIWNTCAVQARAASLPVKITECKLISSGKIRITAKLSNLKSLKGKKCYLFCRSMSDSKKSKVECIKSTTKAKTMRFTVSLNQAKSSSRLYSRFYLAVKNSDGSYTTVSDAKYISNPSKAASYTYSYPKTTSKKGLQVSAAMVEDAVELNVQHSVLNISLSDLISTKEEYNQTASIDYKYHGKTYWFRRSVVSGYDKQLIALKENNTVISAVLLLGWRDDLKYLIYPSGRAQGHAYYAWNTQNASAREQLAAAISFLAYRYSSTSAEYGRIVNWIVGNEVNNYNVYFYAGRKSLSQYANIYANAFRLTYNTVTSIYANARVYISLDHLWNTQVSGAFTARKMLDAFASVLKKQGNVSWNLAYHPYSSPLTEPKFWANTNQQVTQALTSPVINMANINLLTSYIRQKYGKSTRIILSELGFTSVRYDSTGTVDAEKEQSAAIAYGYYLAESDSMIDAYIVNRHVDHEAEVSQGLNLGLWTNDDSGSSGEWAGTTKDSWTVFKYMDTDQAETVTSSSLSVIGVEKWSDVVSNYSTKLYSKTTVASSALRQVQKYQKTASIPSAWKQYGAVTKLAKTDDMWLAYRDTSRNRNCVWGFTQTFTNTISFKNNSWFYTTLKVSGSTGNLVKVKLRFYSGTHILESYGKIRAGQYVRIGTSLQDWKYRGKVTKIQVLIAPSGGKWTEGATIEMQMPVRGK